MLRSTMIRFLLLFAWLAAPVVAAAQQQPNILFVIADDWSYPHAGAYGDRVIRTPHIDAVAAAGTTFDNAFCAAPSCSPSRASILTGQYPHQLEAGSNLWGFLPDKYPNFNTLLEQAGYHVGLQGKGWGPGSDAAGGYHQNPAGKRYQDFATFFREKPEGKPFSFWFGTSDPHRPYDAGSGVASGLDPGAVQVPGWLPDAPEVRHDILDYYYEVERLDRQLGDMLAILQEANALDNTLVIVTSDNGMPFPRGKATLYDAGTRMPLVMSMTGKIPAGRRVKDFVSLTDLAPTILQAAGQEIPRQMEGISLWPLLQQKKTAPRDAVFLERERHANVRRDELGYPSRGIRTASFLFIRNYAPNRWPGGDPELYHSVGPYGDCDASPSKEYVVQHREDATVGPFFERAFEKRPAEELYDLEKDPDQLRNVAADPRYKKDLTTLRSRLQAWQKKTGDARVSDPSTAYFDQFPYFGPPVGGAPSTYTPGK